LRERPNQKNDSCSIKQKNWSVIRRELGYGRYGTQAERGLIAAICADLHPYVNFFLPSIKLEAKGRCGARIYKRYGDPPTPCQRLLALKVLSGGKQKEVSDLYFCSTRRGCGAG
jgi:hypothetical protein